jgi:hypothetical protein
MGNNTHHIFFSAVDGNLLIRILIPLILGLVVSNWLLKRWEGKVIHPLLKSAITSILTFGFTLSLSITLAAGIGYLTISACSHFANQAWPRKSNLGPLLEKVLLALVAVLVWSIIVPGFGSLWTAVSTLILDYRASLIILGYIAMLWPTSHIVKYCLLGIARSSTASEAPKPADPDAERGGRIIGMFERLIILTLVLLGEYSAIGFLITGKSIIRFAQTNEKIRSEYVLVGTMVSYTLAILTGVGVNWLLKLG